MNAAFRSSAPISFAMPPYPKGFKLRREKQRRCNEPDRLAAREANRFGGTNCLTEPAVAKSEYPFIRGHDTQQTTTEDPTAYRCLRTAIMTKAGPLKFALQRVIVGQRQDFDDHIEVLRCPHRSAARGLAGAALHPERTRPLRAHLSGGASDAAISRAARRLNTAELEGRFPKLLEWESGETQPTLKQLEAYVRATRSPIGYLFLPEPPVEPLSIPDFRTIAGRQSLRPSPDLLETIYIWKRRVLCDHDHDEPSTALTRSGRS